MAKKIAIESPFKGDAERNVGFCRNICKWAVLNGFNPYAMHLFFPQFLDDAVPAERMLGITCGLGWTDGAEEVWFCLRLEDTISPGMQKAIERNKGIIADGKPRKSRLLRFSQEGCPLSVEIEGLEYHFPNPDFARQFLS